MSPRVVSRRSAPPAGYLALEQQEFQVQHDATWRTLEAASAQRDLVYRFHGGGGALIGVGFSALSTSLGVAKAGTLALCGLDLAIAFVALISYYNLLGVQELRMLQVKLDAAINFSRYQLTGGGVHRTFFTASALEASVPTLRGQRDPMGLVVTSLRHFFFGDLAIGAAAIVATPFVILDAAGALNSWAIPALGVAIVLCAVLATAVVLVVRVHIDRAIRASEDATRDDINDRFRSLTATDAG